MANTAPTVSIGPPSATEASTGPVTYTVTYTGIDDTFSLAANIVPISTGSAKAGSIDVSGSGNSWTVRLSNITGDGTLGISTKAGSASNPAGNCAASKASATFKVVNTLPAFSISSPSVKATKTGPVKYTVKCSGVIDEISLSNKVTPVATGTATGSVAVTGSGSTYTVTISSITGDGTLGISIGSGAAQNVAGASAEAASTTFMVANTLPAAWIGAPSATLTGTGAVTYTVTYTGPNDTVSLTAGQVTLNKTGTAKGTVGVSGSGNTWTVTISSISGDGALGITIKAGSASNPAGKCPAYGPSQTFTVANTLPKISISAPSVSSIKTGSVTYTVTYSGATSINLSESYVKLNNTGNAAGSVSSVTGSGNTRTVTLSVTGGNGTLWINILPGSASNLAGSAVGAGPSKTFKVTN